MENNVHTQSSQNSLQRRLYSAKMQQPLRGVRQDKGVPTSARIASTQPAPPEKVMRQHQMNSNNSRSQKKSSTRRKTVHLTLWVKPVVKAELERIAEQEGLSVSATGGAFLEKALQQNIDMQYHALLQPIIESAIRKQMRSYSSRLAVLLVRSSFAGEQTRSLVTNILSRQPGVNQDVLKEVLDGSSSTAKRNIKHISPQLADLIGEVEKWMCDEEGGGSIQ
jgi:hypothetical protein